MSSFHEDRRDREDHRSEFALRRRGRAMNDLDDYAFRVHARAARMLAENPAIAGEAPDRLFCRYIVPETLPDYESVLRRAALALLHLRAVDRAEGVSPTTGDEAA